MINATHVSPAEQRAFYDEHGYVVHPELLSQDEVAVLRAALAEVLEESKDLTENNEKFSVKRGDDGQYHVRRIFNPIKHHQAFHDLLYHPRILDAVEALIGPNIQLHHSKLNLKPPSSPDHPGEPQEGPADPRLRPGWGLLLAA
jgi:ectoine hydroxylase-related dioxygenase (phytanoyl-CoA dioxygenase family)